MKAVVTRFESAKAEVYQDGNLKVFDLVPEGMNSNLVFHWVEISPMAKLPPEKNDVQKTFLFFEGKAEIVQDGERIFVQNGDALWLPAGSTHVINNENGILCFIVIKAK
jgi:mannose-6-phosphate isomerase-like protein (cupin superfamily)